MLLAQGFAEARRDLGVSVEKDEEERPRSKAPLLGCSTAEGRQDPGELRCRRTSIEGRRFTSKQWRGVTAPPRPEHKRFPGPSVLLLALREQNSRDLSLGAAPVITFSQSARRRRARDLPQRSPVRLRAGARARSGRALPVAKTRSLLVTAKTPASPSSRYSAPCAVAFGNPALSRSTTPLAIGALFGVGLGTRQCAADTYRYEGLL